MMEARFLTLIFIRGPRLIYFCNFMLNIIDPNFPIFFSWQGIQSLTSRKDEDRTVVLINSLANLNIKIAVITKELFKLLRTQYSEMLSLIISNLTIGISKFLSFLLLIFITLFYKKSYAQVYIVDLLYYYFVKKNRETIFLVNNFHFKERGLHFKIRKKMIRFFFTKLH